MQNIKEKMSYQDEATEKVASIVSKKIKNLKIIFQILYFLC